MNQLQELAQRQPDWSLDEFVQVANQLLAELLPDERVNTRVREVVTPRLVRHYTTQSMLDEPRRQGREARYGYRHLLQVLLLRRLLAAGYGAGAIAQFARAHSDSELETLLQGDVQLTIVSPVVAAAPIQSALLTNSALEFLQTIQTQSASSRSINLSSAPVAMPMAREMPDPSQSMTPKLELTRARQQSVSTSSLPEFPSSEGNSENPNQETNTSPATNWKRIELMPGLEIHLSESFSCPNDSAERQALFASILHTLDSYVLDARN
jgi:DNA-binding transcriptional MerR regulator